MFENFFFSFLSFEGKGNVIEFFRSNSCWKKSLREMYLIG